MSGFRVFFSWRRATKKAILRLSKDFRSRIGAARECADCACFFGRRPFSRAVRRRWRLSWPPLAGHRRALFLSPLPRRHGPARMDKPNFYRFAPTPPPGVIFTGACGAVWGPVQPVGGGPRAVRGKALEGARRGRELRFLIQRGHDIFCGCAAGRWGTPKKRGGGQQRPQMMGPEKSIIGRFSPIGHRGSTESRARGHISPR